MSDAAALLAAIRAAPDDDAPRLIYADWLEEHGQRERAEFIRVQCELARNDSPTLRQREAELLAEHHDAFAGPLASPGLRFRFQRGFPIAFGHTGLFAATETSTDLRPMNHYLRFFPNGLLHVLSTTFTRKQVTRYHREASKLALQAIYILDVLSRPAVITAKEKLRAGFLPETLIDYSGSFESRAITLTEFEPELQRRTVRQYAHMPARHLSSFQ